VKAPPVAQYLGQEILNHSTDKSQPEVQGSKEQESGTNSKRPSRRKQLDRTYRLPKSSRIQPDIPGDGAEDSHGASSDSSLVGDYSAMCQPSHNGMTVNQSNDSLVTEKPLWECEGDITEIVAEEVPQEGVHGQSSAHGRSIPSMGSELAPHRLKATYSSDGAKNNSAQGQPSVTLDTTAEDSQTTVRPSGAEQRKAASPGIDGKVSDDQAILAPSLPHETKPQETTLRGPTPSTPIRQIGSGFQSPLSNDQTATPHTTLFTPVGNGEVLSPLTEDDRTASPADKVEMALPEGFPSSPSCTGQQ
jgi:hypothetical protein